MYASMPYVLHCQQTRVLRGTTLPAPLQKYITEGERGKGMVGRGVSARVTQTSHTREGEQRLRELYHPKHLLQYSGLQHPACILTSDRVS